MTRRFHVPKPDCCDSPAAQHYPSHVPRKGCCDAPEANHRPRHAPTGDICRCGVAASLHKRDRSPHKPGHSAKIIYGIDGEGQGRKDHRYILLAASDESGKRERYIEGDNLSTVECLEFLLKIPANAKCFAYAFNYDLTKILKDLDNKSLFLLFRPELRGYDEHIRAPKPVIWSNYALNLQSTKFVVESAGIRVVVWDIWKFYQCSFVKSLTDWKIAPEEHIDRISSMKDQRSEFDKLDRPAIRNYCFEECRYLSTLARNLIKAHDDAGLKLRNYYGAGSTGGALLKKMKIDQKRRYPLAKMVQPVASSFFGGRFENSVIGEIKGPIHSYDISSAYPYRLRFLPCLEHASWRRTRDSSLLSNFKAALVRYVLSEGLPLNIPWCPLPYRLLDGTITFPRVSGGGWVWREEFLAAQKLFPQVQFKEAWLLDSNCACEPFKNITECYLERCRIGKEGAGIIFKLGPNSCYGKLAQSVGHKPPFQCWIWASMVTSGCRAQLLELLGLHKVHANVLSMATDGIYSREAIECPKPLDTGTDSTGKPLGGWEHKIVEKGVFFARPGIYFPLDPTESEIQTVRGRGLGRKILFDSWQRIVEAWQKGHETVEVANVVRFCGAKSSISVRDLETEPEFFRAKTYGQWVNKTVTLSLSALPKRGAITGQRLTVRDMPVNQMSMPYARGLTAPESQELKQLELEANEQPDGEY